MTHSDTESPLTTPQMWRAFDWAWNDWYYGPRQAGVNRIRYSVEAMLASDERVKAAIRGALDA